MWVCYWICILLGPFVSTWSMYGDAGHSVGSLAGLAFGGIGGGWVAGRVARQVQGGYLSTSILVAPGTWLLIVWMLTLGRLVLVFWLEALILAGSAGLS